MSEGWFNRDPDAIRRRQRRRSQALSEADVLADENDDLEEGPPDPWGDELRLQWRSIMFDDDDGYEEEDEDEDEDEVEDEVEAILRSSLRRGRRHRADQDVSPDVDEVVPYSVRAFGRDGVVTDRDRLGELADDVPENSDRRSRGVRAHASHADGGHDGDASVSAPAGDSRADVDADDISRYRRSRYVANPKDEDIEFDQEQEVATRQRRGEQRSRRAYSPGNARPSGEGQQPERIRSSTRVMPSDDAAADDVGARRRRRVREVPAGSSMRSGGHGGRTSRTDFQPQVDVEAARRARLEMDRMAGHTVPPDTDAYWDAGQDPEPRGLRLPFGRRREKERKAATRGRRRVRHPVLVALAAILVVLAAWMLVLDHNMHIDDDALDMACEGHAWPFKPYYVLIAGADAEDEGAQRTDSIMLARIDPLRKQATLVSIPRDTRVDLGGYGLSKINAAYSYGGPALTTRTVADFASVGDTDVDIAHFFQVGFDGLADLVDAVGGVTVDVPPNTTVDDVTVPAGVQTLDGEQALVFVRCRKTYANGDFQRAENQRVLMGALADKVKHAPPWRWPGIITAASKCIKTDAHAWQFLGVLLEVAGTGSDDIYSAQVPSRAKTIGGVSYVITDEEAWTQMMENVDAGNDPEAMTTS